MKSGRANWCAPFSVLAIVMMGSMGVAYAKDDAAAAQVRGSATFAKYCALCHGAEGKGNGRAARLQQVPPADLTRSQRTDAYKTEIIRKGGAAMSRSISMPSWGEVLSSQDIHDVVAYLQTLRVNVDSRSAQTAGAAEGTER
jgi:mono/diheme cytochrome c family protein